eukprot:SAG22_NODE_3814_length_1519_cov_0.948592_1_plen_104_part_00
MTRPPGRPCAPSGAELSLKLMPAVAAVPSSCAQFWKQLPGLVKDGCILSSVEGKEIATMLHAKATGKPYVKVAPADAPANSEKSSIVKAAKEAETPDYGGAKE